MLFHQVQFLMWDVLAINLNLPQKSSLLSSLY
jgi:hypothetical protein